MTASTRRRTRFLETSTDLVRIYVAALSFLAPLACVYLAARKYSMISAAEGVAEIPPLSTYGMILGLYLPVFGAAAGVIWAQRRVSRGKLGANGLLVAVFGDVFAVVVATVVLLIPVLLYWLPLSLKDVNPYLVWYENVMTGVVGFVVVRYFRTELRYVRADAEERREAPARPPRASKPPRRAPG